jgi:hypothetical protein
MKADAKPTLGAVAALLCKGGVAPDWVINRLREKAELIGYHTKPDGDDSIERLLFESAKHLQELLQLYPRAAKLAGEDYPDCIDDIDRHLEELIQFLAPQVELPRRGPKRDSRRHLCAAVCAAIWEELHGVAQPHSPKLWEACEAYWLACDHPENPSGHIKNWEDFLTTP